MENRYGYKLHRLKRDDPYYRYECALSDQLIKESVIDWNALVFGYDENDFIKDNLSEREKNIVASTVQWLGTPVGRYFLNECGFVTLDYFERKLKREEKILKKMSVWEFIKWRKNEER